MDEQLPGKQCTEDRGSVIILQYHESIFSFLSDEVNQKMRLRRKLSRS
jgi:hypothetical protein